MSTGLRCFWPCLLIALVAVVQSKAPDSRESFDDAKEFLVKYMTDQDKELLPDDFLDRNINLALSSKKSKSWLLSVPWPIFLNYVLPYAKCDPFL